MRRSVRACFFVLSSAFALSAIGCEHEESSPSVGADVPGVTGQPGPASPDLVCLEQKTTVVTIHGSGFAPFPNDTLKPPVLLRLPQIVLTRTQALDGSAADGSAQVPDDPAATAQSHVDWKSDKEMSFDVYEGLLANPGLYNITVTNPDRVQTVTFPGALAAVPRPTLTAVAPDIFTDAQADQTITLTGTGILDVGGKLPTVHAKDKDYVVTQVDGCDPVPGAHAAGIVRTCKTAVFTIKKGDFAPGLVNFTLTNPAPADCASTDAIGAVVVPPPTVASIQPDIACNAQGDSGFTIAGTGFLQMANILPIVRIGDKNINADLTASCTDVAGPPQGPFKEGKIVTCTSLHFVLPKATLAPGDYDIVVTNPPPADAHSVEALKVHITDVPKLKSVAADLICDAQGDQVMTLTGTELLQIGSELPSIKVGTQTFAPTASDGCTDVLGVFVEKPVKACTSLKFTIPANALQPGDYPVIVTNPSPANCVSTETITLHVAAPPKVTGLAQLGICNDQAEQSVTVQGTDFLKVGTALPSVIIDVASVSPSGDGGAAEGGVAEGGTPDAGATGLKFVASAVSGCADVAGTFAEGQVQTCTGVTIKIPKGTLTPGTYTFSVTNPAPAACSASSAPTAIKVEPPPKVASVAPASICQGGGTVTALGEGFIHTPSVVLRDPNATDAAPTDVVASKVDFIDSAQVKATFAGAGLVANTDYDLVLTNPDTCYDTPPHQKVHVTPGPSLVFADPEIVYSGISTRVVLYTTGMTVSTPTDVKVTMVPSGQTAPITELTETLGTNGKVQVIIPKDTAAGTYDVTLYDSLNCPATLLSAIKVTTTTTVAIKEVISPFGWTNSNTAVTIYRDSAAAAPKNAPFVKVPRIFLNPSGNTTTPAIPLTATSFTDANTLTSVVPKGQAAGGYNLIAVNPDGTVGVLTGAFTVTDATHPPPTISSLTPSSVVAQSGQAITVRGSNFRTGATASITGCKDASGNSPATLPTVTNGALNCVGASCTFAVTLDASMVPAGDACVLQVTNTDKTYAIYSAIGVTNASLNLSSPRAGSTMVLARRALSAATGDATPAARFVYAIGGDGYGAAPDGGTPAMEPDKPFNSVESAQVNLFGKMGNFGLQAYALRSTRSFANAVTLGRYIYVCGGTDGTNYLATCERAMILDPLEAPVLGVNDVLLDKTAGLAPGYWYYRVSALLKAEDLDNPGGESLPSDEIIVRVPTLANYKVQVQLGWSAPVDSLGAPIPNVEKYRVYRTAASNGVSGSEVLVAELPATQLTFTDDGSATPQTARPLALGSTGKWAALPSMNVGRKGLAMTWAADPTVANKAYVYAFFGLNGPGDGGAPTANDSYEFLAVTTAANGHETVAPAWIVGTSTTPQARWQMGAFRADNTISSVIAAGTTRIYVGMGETATYGAASTVESALVSAGGQLGLFSTNEKSFGGSSLVGYGVCAANSRLYTFGGGSAGATPTPNQKGKSAEIVNPAPPTLANNSWGDEGLALTTGRYLLGSAVQSSYIFLLGGQTTATPNATNSTETVVW